MIFLCQYSAYGRDGIINITGKISVSSFYKNKKKDSPIAYVPFDIELTDCPDKNKVSLKFPSIQNTSGELAIRNKKADDYARDISIGIYEHDTNYPLKLNSAKEFPLINKGKAKFAARYLNILDKITTAKVAITAGFTLIYN